MDPMSLVVMRNVDGARLRDLERSSLAHVVAQSHTAVARPLERDYRGDSHRGVESWPK